MGDAVICEELRQIFPQIEPTVIERTVAEAKSNGGVDILTHCIEVVLARQEEERNEQRENDDIVLVRSIRKETSTMGQSRNIPLVFVNEDVSGDSCRWNFGGMPRSPLPFPDYHDSSSSNPAITSNETNNPMKFVTEVKKVFPQVSEQVIISLSQQGYDSNDIVNMIIDRPDLQKSGVNESSENQQCSKDTTSTKEINYFANTSESIPYSYWQCETLLRNKFRRVSVNDIKVAMITCNGHYAAAYKLIEEALMDMAKKAPAQNSIPLNTPNSTLNKKFAIRKLLVSSRNRRRIDELHPQLKLEIEFLKKQVMLGEERKNAIYAAHVNKQQYMEEGAMIECGCCFGEFPFEEIVQCSDGHLFCKECLHGYAKEIIFGSAMATVKLVCMGDDCNQPFPYNQLEKCLTKDEIQKYELRLQEDCLAKAELDNLQKCPYCEFAAIIPDDQKVFACMNPKCMKESCVECKEDWKEHFGKKCNEIEKKSQTNLRLSYEEKMTIAKVRKCAKCSLTFTKLDGCNKMTCRCGTTQCYVCRKSGIDYGHFCRHPRDPGKNCGKCSACSLWTDPTEDDELAIKQLEEEATKAKRKLTEEIEQSSKKLKV